MQILPLILLKSLTFLLDLNLLMPMLKKFFFFFYLIYFFIKISKKNFNSTNGKIIFSFLNLGNDENLLYWYAKGMTWDLANATCSPY